MALTGYCRLNTFTAALLVFCAAAFAQETSPASTVPELVLSIHASRARPGQLPDTVTIKITNVSSHEVLIPDPCAACGDGMYGSLFFRSNLRSTAGAFPIMLGGGIADYDFTKTTILERIKKWKRLTPGHTLIFKENIAAETNAMLRGQPGAGSYEFSAAYEAPYISENDQRLLTAAKVHFPRGRMETSALKFTKTAR